MEVVKRKKKLIEVALPLDEINKACIREKSIRFGHPSTLHLWWARRPLAAARAVIFSQMVDDPSEHPELFPTEDDQERERQRLFDIIRELVQWENTSNEDVLSKARKEIWKSWQRTCTENASHPRAPHLFDPTQLPGFHDPFAGGGTLPLEAQRLGLEAYASDLNPVSVLINKALLEFPASFAGRPPVNPQARDDKRLVERAWHGAEGLAEDFRFYGQRISDEAQKRVGELYPKIEITADIVRDRPDLKHLVGQRLLVVTWIWARTVKSPNPAFAGIDVPLVSSFLLSTKEGKEAYVQPIVGNNGYRFEVKVGVPADLESAKRGTKLARGAHFRCLMSGTPIAGEHIKTEGINGRIGARLMAIVAENDRGRVYLSPTREHEDAARRAKPEWRPEGRLVEDARAFTPFLYGLVTWADLFTDRQMSALTALSDSIAVVREEAMRDAILAGFSDDGQPLETHGGGATAYADAIAAYCGLAVSKLADSASNLVIWKPSMDQAIHVFARQAIPMVWDFAECNVFGQAMGAYTVTLSNMARALEQLPASRPGFAVQADAQTQTLSSDKIISTDPPYFDNVPYADLSDFFYVWLRRSLKPVFPLLFSTVAVPKAEELVALTYRHASKAAAGAFFMSGMTLAMRKLAEDAHAAFPVTIYYAFKQSESDGDDGTASTGWETFLEAVINAGFTVDGTWPMRTELTNRMRNQNANALASSIILVCRPRLHEARTATRRDFLNVLKGELPIALARMQQENIAPVDLAQAAIGPGMAVFTRYSAVLDAEGRLLSVREALAIINEVLDEVMAEQEGDFDAETRFAISWFDQIGFEDGDFGVADVLARAKNSSVAGLTEAGIAASRGGKLRLLRPSEFGTRWDPTSDLELTAWKIVHNVIRVLEADGESAAASLVAEIGSKAEVARELAYRLYTIAERRKRTMEALSYNSLVQSWPEIVRLSREVKSVRPVQTDLLGAL